MIPVRLKFLIDENVSRTASNALKNAGHDVLVLKTADPGLEDEEIISKSANESRIIITLDHDFGFLVFNQDLEPYSVLLIRLYDNTPDRQKTFIFQAIEFVKTRGLEFEGNFLVFDGNRIRVRNFREIPTSDRSRGQ